MYKSDPEEMVSLKYDQLLRNRLKANKENFSSNYKNIFYAGSESSIDGTHKAYNICLVRAVSKCRAKIFRRNRVTDFLQKIPIKCLVYFLNLSYEINFTVNKLASVSLSIIKQSRTPSLGGIFQGEKIMLKGSYSIITSRLREFSRMFMLKSRKKKRFHASTT
jgi:DNA integrity scanning protein DisA with diadenylate cyclase activity